MRLASIRRDVNISYLVSGSGRSALVGTHGFCLSGRELRFLDNLESEGIILPDLRGHGKTPIGKTTHGTFFEDCAADVVAICKNHGIDEVDLVGHSMGGRISLELWKRLRNEIKIRSLILICPVIGDPLDNLPVSLLSLLLRNAAEPLRYLFECMNGSGDLLLRLVKSELFADIAFLGTILVSNYDLSRTDLKRLWELFEVDSRGLVVGYKAMREDNGSGKGILRDIDAPVLMISAGKDPLVDGSSLQVAYERHLDGRNGNRHLHIADSGHVPHIEAETEVLRGIRDFLGSIKSK